jgi:hypothetical protein
MHGGGAPQAKAAAERRAVEARAEALLRRTLHDDSPEPVTSYTAEVGRVAGALRSAVAVSGAVVNDRAGDWTTVDVKGSVNLHPEVELWRRLSEQYGSLLIAAARLGLEERLVTLQEQEQTRFADALRWLVGRLGRNWSDPEVQDALRAMLAALDTGQPLPAGTTRSAS